MTTPHSLFTIVLATAIPKSFDCLPCVSITFPVKNNFPLSFGSHIGPVIGLLIVFPKDVLYIVVNLGDRFGYLLFPTLVQGFSESPQLFLILLSQRVLAVDPLANHLTVATQLHCGTIFACVNGSISGP